MSSTQPTSLAATAPRGPAARLRRAGAAALLGGLVLVAGACSAGASSDGAPATTAAPSTTAAAADDGVRGGQVADGGADDGGAIGGGATDGGATDEPVGDPAIDPEQIDTEEGGRGDVLPPDEGVVDEGELGAGGVDGGGVGVDGGGVGGGTDAGPGGGTAYPAGPVIGGVPLDMSQPFDVGREWAIAANYGDFALVDRLSCANDARAVAQGQPHQASLAALRQTVVERFEPLDDHQGYLYWSVQKVQLNERVNGRIPMVLEADGWKVCYYPQF